MKRYCLALDLKDDAALITEYKVYHENVWPEILQSLKDSGIITMEIYLAANRLFLVMETTDDFSLERKAQLDAANTHVQQWETLMWKYQQALPTAKPGQKWVLMERVFVLK
jgi:L-rhamnose mutarotase